MRHPSIPNTLLTFLFYSTLITPPSAAAALLPLSPSSPSSHENHHLSLSRRGNISTSSSAEYSLKANTKPGNLTTFSNSSSGSTNRLKTTTGTLLNTNPKVGGWCTFHLTYSVSDQLGYSAFQFNLYDAEGAGVALGSPTDRLIYRWLDRNGNPNFNQPALHFGSRLPYDITVLPHPQENLTWAYNEFSMEIPRPDECRSKNQAPITVGTDPVRLSVGCFQNNAGYKRGALVDPDVEPYRPGRRYGATSQIDGGWSC